MCTHPTKHDEDLHVNTILTNPLEVATLAWTTFRAVHNVENLSMKNLFEFGFLCAVESLVRASERDDKKEEESMAPSGNA